MAAYAPGQAAVESMCQKVLSKRDQFSEPGVVIRAEIIAFAKSVAALDVDKDAKIAAFGALVDAMKTSLTTQHDVAAFVSALEALRGQARAGDFDGDGDAFADDFRAAFQRAVAAAGDVDVDAAPELAKLTKIGRPVTGGGDDDASDDDVMVDEGHEDTEAGLKDPLTTALLVKPVTSKKCGHTYSESSAKQYFKGAGKKCAVFGCSAMLTFADFRPDKAKEVQLRNLKKKQQRTQRTQAEDVDASDDDE